jgi:hypothetical protein
VLKRHGVGEGESELGGEMLLQCAKTKLRKLALKESESTFLMPVDAKEIDSQLDGSLCGVGQESWEAHNGGIVHHSEERRHVVKFLCDQPSGRTEEGQTRPSRPYDRSHGRILPSARSVKSEMIRLQP